MEAFTGSTDVYCTIVINSNAIAINQDNGAGGVMTITASPLHRDPSSWFHLLVSVDTTQTLAQNRVRIYVNGDEEVVTYSTTPSINFETHFNRTGGHRIGTRWNTSSYINAEYTDIFLVDGQALTPDVFGFYKDGNGYISAGSTQSTDFRPGQWVPKTPRVIKAQIERNGGFGVNGFYLPMNDSSNFGADFHTTPNSIITLKGEDLPQPRNGAPTTTDAYVSQLRTDPYADNLVLAVPGISGGQGSGYGDYSADIKGSGSNKTVTANGNAGIAAIPSYYGSALSSAANGGFSFEGSDFAFGSGDFTFEGWFYISSDTSVIRTIFDTRTTDNNQFGLFLGINDNDNLYTYGFPSGTGVTDLGIPAINQWHHVAVERNGSIGTVYLNGVAVSTVNMSSTNYTQSGGTLMRPAAVFGDLYNFYGYVQDFRVYKGVAKYTGGFDVPRPYTPVGIGTWRAVPDTTANNFATWNPIFPTISGSQSSFTNGNLTVSDATSNGGQGSATIGVSTGKWYYEAIPTVTSSGSNLIGIRPAEWFTYNVQNRTAWRDNGFVFNDDGTTAQSGTTYTTNDIIGIAIDMNTRKLWFSKNGSWVYSGDPDAGTNPAVSFATTYTHYTPAFSFDNAAGTEVWNANFGQNPTFSGQTTSGTNADDSGKGLFKYAPPSGFLALCEDNLPTPAIADPGDYMRTVLWTGDGNSGRSITGVGFTPDLVWMKKRDTTADHWLFDSIRGPLNLLESSTTDPELNRSTSLQSFDEDGFSMGADSAYNTTGANYVAWCWKAGGPEVTNTDGTITSQVSANQTAGFSIVSYTGDGNAGATFGHGLGKTPGFIIVKRRDGGSQWNVWTSSLTNNQALYLNLTNDVQSSTTFWNDTDPNSSVITLGTDRNVLNGTYIAYCWAEIEGFSKFGSYVGNGSADGAFVYCGFKPAFVMLKASSATGNWCMIDNARNSTNPTNFFAIANSSNAGDDTGGALDFLSNGFKLRLTSSNFNGNGVTYIFAAFAESPINYSNSK